MDSRRLPTSKLITQIKRNARRLARASGLPYTGALESLARRNGYPDWHTLHKATASGPHVSVICFGCGELDDLVGQLSPVPYDVIQYIKDRWLLATDPTSTRKRLYPHEEAFVSNELDGIVLSGGTRPRSVQDALAFCSAHSRWAPWFCWLDGMFYDFRDRKRSGSEAEEDLAENPYVQRMVRWFEEHYKDPVDGVPFVDGEYLFISGRPYDPWQVIREQFSNAPARYVEFVQTEVSRQVGFYCVRVEDY